MKFKKLCHSFFWLYFFVVSREISKPVFATEGLACEISFISFAFEIEDSDIQAFIIIGREESSQLYMLF